MNTLTLKTSSVKGKSPEISRLIKFMQLKKLKVSDIERDTGISKRTIENFIHSNLPIGVQLLRKLHEKYSVSIDWLISGIGEMLITHNISKEPPSNYCATDSRSGRLHRFIAHFTKTSNPDEQAWLEMHIKFSVPQYAKFLEQENDNG